MPNLLVAGNSTNGGTAITTDTSGTLNIVTGSGSGTTAITVDGSQNVTFANAVSVTGNNLIVSSSSALGYGTGSGGTVTQATNKSTAVTLNKPAGTITMNAAALASGASVQFTLNNSLISSNDVLTVAKGSGGSQGGYYEVRVDTVLSGSAVIFVKNISGVSVSEAVTINFAIIKATTA